MRVLTGIQPSGQLHLGNYFGMMRPVIELQQRAEVYLFIANYHALTTMEDPAALRAATHDLALDLLTCGFDPEKGVFYVQSDLPELTELTWLLSNVTPMGLLERCHAYKDKTSRGLAANHGLFAYPVLMAADILAVQSDLVPVGRDQKQHLEVARDIAIKFNHRFGDVFTVPEPQIAEEVAVIPGLDGQKMSSSYGNTIPVFGSAKAARKAIMRIVTDSKTVEEPKEPDTSTIYTLYRLLAQPEEAEALAARYRAGGMGYGDAKKALADAYETAFGPLGEKREALAADPSYVQDILATGARRARETIGETLHRARAAMGLE